jgi:hypothetical protein
MSVSKLKLAAGVLAVAGGALAFTHLYHAQQKLNDENDSLRQQLAQLQTENGSLSNNLLVAAGTSKGLATVQLTELLKLRSEVGQLQRQVGELDKLRGEIQRLQAVQHQAPSQPLSASAEALEQQQQAAMASLNYARQGVLAFIMYANENQQQFPPSFDQAAPFFKEGLAPVEMNFEIVYVGSITNITNAPATIVLREKHASQTLDGKWRKTYGFADGHAETHTEPDGNFDEWESQHMIPPLPGQPQ